LEGEVALQQPTINRWSSEGEIATGTGVVKPIAHAHDAAFSYTVEHYVASNPGDHDRATSTHGHLYDLSMADV